MAAAKAAQEQPVNFTAPISSREGGGGGMTHPGGTGGPGGGTGTDMGPLASRRAPNNSGHRRGALVRGHPYAGTEASQRN